MLVAERSSIPSPVGFRTIVVAEDGESLEDLVLTIVALVDKVVDDYKARHRELTCDVHRGSKRAKRPTRCAICALVEARTRYRHRVLSEDRPVA